MAHIQRGDERKYFANGIANKDFTGEYANTLNQMVQGGYTVAQKAYASDLANKQQQFSNELYKKNNELNIKWQADPTNPELEKERTEAFEKIAESFKINPVVQGEWDKMRNEVENRFSQYNTQWQVKQQETNASLNLKNNYEALTNQASMLGYDGADIEQVRLCYANGIEALRKGATPQLGEVVVNDALNSSTHDFMTSYISALAINNPLEAQKLLQDEGVRGDLDNAETIEKLENYVAYSLANQSKRTAVSELCSVLRNMKSDEADTILNGQADFNRVMKFIESNKNLPKDSKDLILGIYGIGSKSEYYYDRDRGRITKEEKRGARGGASAGNTIPAGKMTAFEKQRCSEMLESDLHKLINFSVINLDNKDAKADNIKNKKKQKEASDFSIQYLKSVASMQGRIDSAYSAGAITKEQRNAMTQSYIAPVTDYLESNFKQLDEGRFMGAGEKLGYDKIAKQFSTEGLKGDELKTMQRQKLFAQNYYLDELNKVVAKVPSLNSIYDIESLPSRQQQEIYKTASENALKRAKRWTDKPEYFFAKEYPTVYSLPFTCFNKEEAGAINRAVAQEVYKYAFEDTKGNSTLELQDFAENKMITEINNKAKINKIKAGETLNLRNTEMNISNPYPKNINEFYKRVKALGVTPEQFMEDARKRGFLELQKPKTIGQAIKQAHNEVIGNYEPMAGYYEALRQAEQAKARQDKLK